MIRRLLVAIIGILLVCAGTLAGLAVAMRWPFECLRSTEHLCEPYASLALGPLIGFTVSAWLLGTLAKRYYRRRAARASFDDQAA